MVKTITLNMNKKSDIKKAYYHLRLGNKMVFCPNRKVIVTLNKSLISEEK